MPESVSVEHGGMTVTSNTASEADLRAELAAGDAAAATPAPETPPPAESAPPERARDAQGRFLKADGTPEATPPAPPPEAEGQPAAPAPREPLPRHNPIARMNQALAQKAEAERRAAALEAELARVRQPALPMEPPAPPPGSQNGHEPQFEQFANEADPYTAYMQAWTRWDRAQAIAQARVEWEAEQTTRAKAASFKQALETGRTVHADFDQVLTQADTLGLQVSAVMQDAIAESPHAADLVYFLATHPEECLQLAEETQSTPVAAAPVMRRLLESRLAPRAAAPAGNGTGPGTAARAAVSTAKPPVTPVGSSPVVSDAPPGDEASAAEHARYWNRKLKVPGTT